MTSAPCKRGLYLLAVPQDDSLSGSPDLARHAARLHTFGESAGAARRTLGTLRDVHLRRIGCLVRNGNRSAPLARAWVPARR